MAMPMGVLLNILVLCTVVAKLSCAELAILSSLESPEFKQGRAIDALGEVVFVAGSGVTAVNVSKHHDLEVADTLHDTRTVRPYMHTHLLGDITGSPLRAPTLS